MPTQNLLRRLIACWYCALALCMISKAGRADLTAAQVERGKHATALVELKNARRTGSAFCIDPAGYFLTNEHVVSNIDSSETINVVINSGEVNQQILPATVVLVNAELDLALLRVTSRKALTFLEPGEDERLIETASVTAFGYPFGTELAEKKNTYPNVTVSLGHITALRKTGGRLAHIQLDASLNPGNSGGPVLDARGQAIGIVQAGIPGSGVNLAIPVSTAGIFLSRPNIVFTPPANNIRPEAPQDFTIHIKTFHTKPERYKVSLLLDPDTPNARNFPAQHIEDSKFSVRAPLIPRNESKPLQLTARSSLGTITCRVRNQGVKVNGKSLQLSMISSFENNHEPYVLLLDGKRLEGKLTGIEAVEAIFGAGVTQTLDFRKFDAVTIEEVEQPAGNVKYRIEVRQDGGIVATTNGEMALPHSEAPKAAPIAAGNNNAAPSGNKPAGVPDAKPVPVAPVLRRVVTPRAIITPTPLIAPKVIVPLPAEVADVVVGGGGRYIILHMPKLRKLAIFDVNEGKVTRYLSMASEDIALTAGNEKLIVLLNDVGILQRWNLKTGEREANVSIPGYYPVYNIIMGSASDGPVVLFLRSPGIIYIDIATMARIEFDWRKRGAGYAAPHWGTAMRASADGTVFTSWQTDSSPSGVHYNFLQGDILDEHYVHDSYGYVTTNGDGSLVCTSRGIFNSELKLIAPERFKNMMFVPAAESTYFLGVPARQGEDHKKVTPSLYTTSDKRLLFTLPTFEELDTPEQWGREKLTLDKRLMFIPAANLIVTLSDARNQLVLRKFNVQEMLEKSGEDYLFVASVPERLARKGKRYNYQIVVKSKQGGAQYKLDSGPAGMTISPGGLLTWQVPTDANPQENILVTIHDRTGQEVFHTFNINVE